MSLKLLQTVDASLQSPTSPSNVVYRGTIGCIECKIMKKLWKHMEKEKGHKQAEEKGVN